MPEEIMDAKTSTDSSSEQVTTSDATVKTQEVEDTSTEPKESNQTPFHEHPRFKEIIQSNRELKAQIDLLKNQRETRSSEPQKSAYTKSIERYIAKGVDPNVARELVQDQVELAREISFSQTQPLMETHQQMAMKVAFDGFKATHKDFDKVKGDMLEVINNLPSGIKQAVALNPSEGLDLVYDKVMSLQREKIEQEAVQKGRDEAYSNKIAKSAQSSSSTSSPVQNNLEKELADMDLETYMKNKKKYDLLERKMIENLK